MKASGDLQDKLTAETRSRGENEKSTTEAQRHGGRSVDLVIARDRVIGVAAGSDQIAMAEYAINPCHPERVGAYAGAPNTRVFRVVGWSHATASRRPPTKTVFKHAASGSSYETIDLTAETRSRGENQKSTTEARGHGESHRNAFSDHPITGSRAITRSLSISVFLRGVMQTLKATLREIFDESAYDRFLLRTHASRSVASYRAFTSERDADMVKKPRCC